jgi:predicted nucleic acid-binding protein
MIRLGNFNAVLDSCVLYDSLIRDLLLNLAARELYRPVWSNTILDELKRNLVKKIKEDKVKNLIIALNEVFPSAMVTNTKSIELKETGIDKKDHHVVTTAIRSNSQVIVTYNTKHFPVGDLEKFSIEIQTPDVFLINILQLSFKTVLDVYCETEKSFKNPPILREELLLRLKNRVPDFTDTIAPYLDGSITRLY